MLVGGRRGGHSMPTDADAMPGRRRRDAVSTQDHGLSADRYAMPGSDDPLPGDVNAVSRHRNAMSADADSMLHCWWNDNAVPRDHNAMPAGGYAVPGREYAMSGRSG